MLSRWLTAVVLCLMAATAQADANADHWQYTVRPGDTLWNLCERFAQDPVFCWRQLAANSAVDDPYRMSPGKVILIPLAWLKEQPMPARAERVNGQVWLLVGNNDPEPVENGAEIAFGDTIETGEAGSVVVRFADNSEVAVKPDTVLKVNHYRRFVDVGNEPTELQLERGAIRNTVTPRDTDARVFRVYTPGVMTAVRGTEYHVRVTDDAVTLSEVVKGEVEVAAARSATPVPAGYGTLARDGQAPAQPVKLLPAPRVTLKAGGRSLRAEWPPVEGAEAYSVELFDADGVLLQSDQVSEPQWRAKPEAGDYQLLVRAIDARGLRGQEHLLDATVSKGAWPWDALLFIGGAGLLLAL